MKSTKKTQTAPKSVGATVKKEIPKVVATTVKKVIEPKKDSKYHKMDRTKYLFNKETKNKSRLVLAITKQYVTDNPKVTITKLKEVFPDSMQKSFGVIRSLPEIKKRNDKYPRFFTKDNDLLKLADGTVIGVTSQWGIGNINEFLKIAKQLGYTITVAPNR